MTLATHILVAGAVSKPFLGPFNPLLIFVLSGTSHYMADFIPHYDYKLKSIEWDEENKASTKIIPSAGTITYDLLKITIDILIGTFILVATTHPAFSLENIITYTMIVLGGILPDALQPVYIMLKKFPMTWIQNLHDFFHAETRLKFGRLALLSQGALALVSIYFLIK